MRARRGRTGSKRPRWFGKVQEPIVESPFRDVTAKTGAEGEVGRLARLERGRHLVEHLILCGLHEIDLLAGLLLEGGDDLPDRFVLLGIKPLFPPHHEVGGGCAERRHDQRRGENDGMGAHYRSPEIEVVDARSAAPVRQKTSLGPRAGAQRCQSADSTQETEHSPSARHTLRTSVCARQSFARPPS
jgi:hypothetical protein